MGGRERERWEEEFNVYSSILLHSPPFRVKIRILKWVNLDSSKVGRVVSERGPKVTVYRGRRQSRKVRRDKNLKKN